MHYPDLEASNAMSKYYRRRRQREIAVVVFACVFLLGQIAGALL